MNLIMYDPDLLDILIEEFFLLRKKDKMHPTLPGLALWVGFNKVADITETLMKWSEEDTDYPDRAVQYLVRAITRIEDHFLQAGLDAKIPAALTKFCLGVYHECKEPTRNEGAAGVGSILIAFEAPPEAMRLVSDMKDKKKQLPGSGKLIGSSSSEGFELEFD